MIDEAQARKLAEAAFGRPEVALGEARELQQGWLFSRLLHVPSIGGQNNVIVHKRTGRTFCPPSGFPVERCLYFYDRGYQSFSSDLVIVRVTDIEDTLRVLQKLRPTVVEPTYDHGQVWRIPRALSDEELRQRLSDLPSVFGALNLYPHLELLEEARAAGWFDFEALEYR